MEVITRAEALKYLRGPYAKKVDTVVMTTKNIATPGKDSIKTQDNHKRLEKNSENVKSEAESEETKALPASVEPKRGQVVQVWFGRKKRSPRGNEEAKIGAEQFQETRREHVQNSPNKNEENINGIKDVEDIEDINDTENMEDIEDMEDIENIEDIDTFENFEDIDDIEVEENDDMEGEETLENGTQTEEPEIKSEEPKNGKTLNCNAFTLPREFMATTWV